MQPSYNYVERTPDHDHCYHHRRPARRNAERPPRHDLAHRPHAWPGAGAGVRGGSQCGMLLPDGSRRRTLGSIFFYLVRTQVSDDQAIAINIVWRSQ
jgi:hypothetical protein